MDLFVSTSGTRGSSLDSAQSLVEHGFRNIELSGGCHIEDLEKGLENLTAKTNAVMLHNYFPPPREPFVFNLASGDFDTVELSMSLAKSAIEISSKYNFPYFAIHGGFLMDPKVSELGNKIQPTRLLNRNLALDIFTQNALELSSYARELNVELLVENNVLSEENMKSFGEDPFLLSSTAEIHDFFTNNGNEIGFLLDLGHFNVSTHTLGEPRDYSLMKISDFAIGYHLHDNSRLSDQHLALSRNSWFLSFLNPKAKFGTLEIHSQDIAEIQKSVRILEGALSGA
jgi:sugar phosphate isomerase/epimerase